MGVMTTCAATFSNYYRPILPRPSVLRDAARREAHDLSAAVDPTLDAHFPNATHIGLVKDAGDWEWPLFGRGLKRRITPLPLDREDIERSLAEGKVNLVLASKSIAFDRLPPIMGEGPLSLVRTGQSPWHDFDGKTDGTWSFVLPPGDDDDVLFPTRDWTPSRQLWCGTKQGFVPARRLPPGYVVVELEPGPLVVEESFEFHLYAGDALVDSFSVSEAGAHRHRVRWPGSTEGDVAILRIEVSSADEAFARRLDAASRVYRLLSLPRFEETDKGNVETELED
jgi:hypothetical protein